MKLVALRRAQLALLSPHAHPRCMYGGVALQIGIRLRQDPVTEPPITGLSSPPHLPTSDSPDIFLSARRMSKTAFEDTPNLPNFSSTAKPTLSIAACSAPRTGLAGGPISPNVIAAKATTMSDRSLSREAIALKDSSLIDSTALRSCCLTKADNWRAASTRRASRSCVFTSFTRD